MFTAKCKLKSVSPYSQSKYFMEKKTKDETYEVFENRIWKERAHWNSDGNLIIPPMAFKNCLSEAAKYKPVKIPGRGNATYTKNIVAGVLALDPLVLPITRETIAHEWLFLPSNGKTGAQAGGRVEKCFPLIHSWEGVVTFQIFDESIPEDIFKDVLVDAGAFIGIGRFRPRNNGFYGRFSVEAIDWS